MSPTVIQHVLYNTKNMTEKQMYFYTAGLETMAACNGYGYEIDGFLLIFMIFTNFATSRHQLDLPITFDGNVQI